MGEFVMVRFDIEDDERLAEIYPDDANLGLWLRLLMLADHAWPKPAYIPRSTNKRRLQTLVDAGVVVLVDGDRYHFHGLDAERQRRVDSSKAALDARWHTARTTSSDTPRTASRSTETIPARAAAPPPPPLSLSLPPEEKGVQGEGEDAAVAYFEVTTRVPKGQSLAWINELATDHGEGRLCAAIRATDADPPKTFLSRVQLSLTTVTVGERAEVVTVKTEEEFMAREAAKGRPARILDMLAAEFRGAT
jgi:hypothetical protein